MDGSPTLKIQYHSSYPQDQKPAFFMSAPKTSPSTPWFQSRSTLLMPSRSKILTRHVSGWSTSCFSARRRWACRWQDSWPPLSQFTIPQGSHGQNDLTSPQASLDCVELLHRQALDCLLYPRVPLSYLELELDWNDPPTRALVRRKHGCHDA